MNADEVRRGWAGRSTEYSPDYYAYYGPNETSQRVAAVLDGLVEPGDPVLEVGCSSGRHLEHLRRRGYRDLHGLDINEDAFDVMAREYPDLAEAGTFYRSAIEDAVGSFEDDRFGAVFSVRTLQHVHHDDAWVFAELARVAGEALVTVECEEPGEGVVAEPVGEGAAGTGEAADGAANREVPVNYVNDDFPLYYRDWQSIFTDRGMVEVESRSIDGDTLRAFRPAG